MVTIYCIEDINDLKYVGSTKQKLNKRLWQHRTTTTCSSSNLYLDNCKIYSLETCNESNRKERERYWINKLDCINTNKLNFDNNQYLKKYNKKYYQKNIQQLKDYDLFRSKKVVNGCYEFIKMLEEY